MKIVKTTYAVELFFDVVSDKAVRSIWRGLADEGIDSSMMDASGAHPHVTLAVYDALDIDTFLPRFQRFAKDFASLPLRIDSIGAFPTTGTCFFKPVVTEGLLALHGKYHSTFASYVKSTSQYYLPGQWNPHCTVATFLKPNTLQKVLPYCAMRFSPIVGRFEKMGLVRIDWYDDDSISCKDL